jgi:hypothetical protein
MRKIEFRDELTAFKRLVSLQGTGIPRCFGAGRLDLTNTDTPRAISPPVLLIEYLDNSNTFEEDHLSLVTLANSLLDTVKSFGRCGVTHGDMNNGNIVFSLDPPRASVIDFGGSALRWKVSDEEWDDVVATRNDNPTVFMKLMKELKGYYDLTSQTGHFLGTL